MAVGDYDGDGKGELVWRRDTGEIAIWSMNGFDRTNAFSLGNPRTAWTLVTQ